MSDPDQITIAMSVLGNFKGVEALLRTGKITQAEAANLRSYSFKRIGHKILEIRKEVARLHAVVDRLESICRQGAQMQHPSAGNNEVAQLRQAVAQLHGWTISLVESDYELISRTEDPTVAGGHYRDLSTQLYKLRLDRQITRQQISGKGRISV